jgi:hypothetical protein
MGVKAIPIVQGEVRNGVIETVATMIFVVRDFDISTTTMYTMETQILQ